MSKDKYTSYYKQLESLSCQGNLRELQAVSQEGGYVICNGKKYINLCSNDYLGIATDELYWKEFISSQSDDPEFGAGAGASRLLTGDHSRYRQIEHELANKFNREAALFFNSGYHANVGILSALAGKNDLIVADKLIHASLIDGIKLSDATFLRYRHADLEHLESILEKNAARYDKVFIVTESVFSMDGDIPDLVQIVNMKNKYGAFLYVDEAHAFGVFGERGLGICEQMAIIPEIDMLVGTFGKAMASQGAFIICNQVIRDFLVNKMRTLIYTTALPPVSVKWSLMVLDKLDGLKSRRTELKILTERFKAELSGAGFSFISQSQILPIIIGDNLKCIALADLLKEAGLWAMPLRPPTVPIGSSRLRVSLNPSTNFNDLKKLTQILKAQNHADLNASATKL